MYFWYILKKYVKNFFTVLFALGVLFVIVDLSFNFSKLPYSSNLQVLYVSYQFLYALFILYPLAIIFSFLLTVSSMIKFNEFVSFYSLGFLPKKLLMPFFFFSLFFTFFVFLIQSTKLAYINQYAAAIKSSEKLKDRDLFLKHNNKVVYIKELNPIFKIANDVRVFEINGDLKKMIYAPKAYFVNNRWYAKNAEITYFFEKEWIKEYKDVYFLKNFKPKILSSLKSLNEISFYDAYLTIRYFRDIDESKILAIVFFKIFTPLSMIALMVIFFLTAPVHIRLSNITLFMIQSIILSILLWGGELLLFKFSKQGIIPYWSIAVPFVILFVLDIYFLRRKNEL
ncbi:MAG: LptF/LptG family permease [Nautiliaceae bacterium]